jgi:hypothetical protein
MGLSPHLADIVIRQPTSDVVAKADQVLEVVWEIKPDKTITYTQVDITIIAKVRRLRVDFV